MAKFHYYNMNPLGLHEKDCVIRAISLCTSTDYLDVIDLLEKNSGMNSCDTLMVSCYSYLLDNYFRFRKVNCKDMNVRDFAKYHPFGIFLIRMEGHLSSLINGVCYDIWDCTNEPLTDVWRVDS